MLAIVKLLGGWRASIFAVLAVAAVIGCLFLRGNLANASLRADAAEQRAQEAEGQVRALRESARRDVVAAEATDVARKAADARQPEREARAARVKEYADSAVSACLPDARIVRELREGTDRTNRAINRLRGDGQPEGVPADDSDG